jgi:hypothetical protein
MCDFGNGGRRYAFGCLPVQAFDGRQLQSGQLFESKLYPHGQ